ncbi:CHAD domain-containing protein [Streptomyces sp. S6]|nr:CHAD domain-containing protein [Streptomyces sp. S6]
MRRSARRISGSLHTFRTVLDPAWADHSVRNWPGLSGTLAREHAYAGRLTRLLDALHQLSGGHPPGGTRDEARREARHQARHTTGHDGRRPDRRSPRSPGPGRPRRRGGPRRGAAGTPAHPGPDPGPLRRAPGPRLLPLPRVADAVALLASEVPLAPGTTGRGTEALLEPAERAEQRLLAAVVALPADESAEPYNEAQDAAWHQARLLLRLHRYAHEVVLGAADPVLTAPGTPWTCTGTRRRRPRRRPRRPAPRGSPRPPRTPSGCSTRTSGTRWRPRGRCSGRPGRTRRP